MDHFVMMKAFVAVVEEGSFAAASRRLGTSPQLISKYVLALERDLGVTLLNRTTRKVNRTEGGHGFFEKCVSLLEDYDDLLAEARQEHTEPRGHLRISVPVTFAEIYMADLLTKFSRAYPDISINMRLTDRFVDLLEENIDVAIRIGRPENSALVARRITGTQLICCASPDYIARAGAPATPEDLSDHACILDTNLRATQRWPFVGLDKEEFSVWVTGPFTVNSATAAIDLARKGGGIVRCPSLFVARDLASGHLVNVLADVELPELGMFALFHEARRPAAKIRVFIDFMVKAFRARQP